MILFLNICTFQRHHKFNWCLHCYQSYKDYRKNGPKKFAYILHHYLEKDMWATCQLKFPFQLFVPLVLFCQQKKFTVIFYIFLFITHFFPQKCWVSLKNFKQQGRKLKKKCFRERARRVECWGQERNQGVHSYFYTFIKTELHVLFSDY